MSDIIDKGRGRILLGTIVGVYGIRGQVRIRSWTGDICAVGSYGALFGSDGNLYELSSVRLQKGNVVIASVAGFADRTASESLIGVDLSVAREALGDISGESGEADSYYHADLVGLSVFADDGTTCLGEVVAVYNYGAGDLLEVRLSGKGGDILLSFNRDTVERVNIESGEIGERVGRVGIYLSSFGVESLNVGG